MEEEVAKFDGELFVGCVACVTLRLLASGVLLLVGFTVVIGGGRSWG